MALPTVEQIRSSLFSKPTPLIGAIMKREAPYIVEWVAWHKLQGFDLLIADNCREGSQTNLLLKLADAELIRYIDFRHHEITPQLAAYRKMIRRAIWEGYRYFGFLDADEFFEPLIGDGLGSSDLVVRQLEQEGVKAVSFRWCIFGSNGHKNFSDGMVLERFTRRGKSEARFNQWVKSFVRLPSVCARALLTPMWLIKDPHIFEIDKQHYCLDGKPSIRMEVGERQARWNCARIRHYAVKSKEEFMIKRGRGDGIFLPGAKPDYSTYWEDFDLNEIDDPMDPRLLNRLKSSIEDIYKIIN